MRILVSGLLDKLAGNLQAAVEHIEPSEESRKRYPGQYKGPDEAKAEHEHVKKNEEKYRKEIRKYLPPGVDMGEKLIHATLTKPGSALILLGFDFKFSDQLSSAYLEKFAEAGIGLIATGEKAYRGFIHLDRLPE